MEGIEDERTREEVLALLEGIDVLHRQALGRLLELVTDLAVPGSSSGCRRTPCMHPPRDVRSPGGGRTDAGRARLESVYPYFKSHGGKLEVLGVEEGRVRVRLSGSCEGCPGTATTLTRVVEEALREGFPGFRSLWQRSRLHRRPEKPIQLGTKAAAPPAMGLCRLFGGPRTGGDSGPAAGGYGLAPGATGRERSTPIANGCPPGSALALHLGRLEDSTWSAPGTGAATTVRTGKREDDEEGKLAALPVAVRDGEIKIAVGVEEVEPE
jgi:Fe-S cluster biogenesis protein NfuA